MVFLAFSGFALTIPPVNVKIISKLTTSYTRWNIWSYVLKKKFILKNKIFFQNLKQNEDWIYTFELLNKVKKYGITYKHKNTQKVK